jgi:hypothetical protein
MSLHSAVYLVTEQATSSSSSSSSSSSRSGSVLGPLLEGWDTLRPPCRRCHGWRQLFSNCVPLAGWLDGSCCWCARSTLPGPGVPYVHQLLQFTCTQHADMLSVQVGAQHDFGFDAKDHVALGEALGILDFETASEVRQKHHGGLRTWAQGPGRVCSETGGEWESPLTSWML